MQWHNSSQRYGAISQSLHWLTVVLIVAAWLLGEFGDALPRGPARAGGLFVHNSAGLAVAMLLLIRLLWRWGDGVPAAEPTPFGAMGEAAAKLGHVALYLLLFGVPAIGIVLQFARGDAVPLFGLTEIASPWPHDRAFARSVKEVHEFAANALMVLAALHAAAALAHHWLLRDGTLRRMLPGAAR